jgi:hypothetical protein
MVASFATGGTAGTVLAALAGVIVLLAAAVESRSRAGLRAMRGAESLPDWTLAAAYAFVGVVWLALAAAGGPG